MEQLSDQFNYIGSTNLMEQPKTVFFCPYDATDEVFKLIREWIASLNPEADTIVCGNSSGIERYTLRILLKSGFSVILPLATTIPENLEELNLGWKLSNKETTEMLNNAFDDHRLLLVSSVENVSVSVPTRETMILRNNWMRNVGSRFVVAVRRRFDYFDRLLLGKDVKALIECPALKIEKEEIISWAKKALHWAYREHDRVKINYYKQLLAV